MIRLTQGIPPKIIDTRLNSKKPTNPQFMAPMMTNVRTMQSKVLFLIKLPPFKKDAYMYTMTENAVIYAGNNFQSKV